MEKLVVATKNAGKIVEIENLCGYLVESGVHICGLNDYQTMPDIDENGESFLENAVIKAKTAASFTGEICIADDSGIVVDVLGGIPGIKSARFGSSKLDDVGRYMKLLNMLENVPCELRTARFVCAVAIAEPTGKVWTTGGKCEGIIADNPVGDNGFGYDPIFYIPEVGKTFAQLTLDEKNAMSHRAVALKNAEKFLKNLFF